MVHSSRIVELHDAWNVAGHGDPLSGPTTSSPLEELILRQHQANFDLWHEEDKARDPEVADRVIAQLKHSIDRLNQQRNDIMEQIDTLLLEEATQNVDAKLHSETPGLIIDRLSIISLKIFHSRDESGRPDATESHRERNLARWQLLAGQRQDLAGALDELWLDIESGERRFKLYKQMKMYNDPSLNPVLYRRAQAGSQS